MRILIAGATGFIGKSLVQELHQHRYKIHVLTRDKKKAQAVLPKDCEVFVWKNSESEVPIDALDGVEAVIHLAGESVSDGRWNEAKKTTILW